jgi:hypothetical protein
MPPATESESNVDTLDGAERFQVGRHEGHEVREVREGGTKGASAVGRTKGRKHKTVIFVLSSRW